MADKEIYMIGIGVKTRKKCNFVIKNLAHEKIITNFAKEKEKNDFSQQ